LELSFSLDRHGALQVDAVMLVGIRLSVSDTQNEETQEGKGEQVIIHAELGK
jgi:hypothetical protein